MGSRQRKAIATVAAVAALSAGVMPAASALDNPQPSTTLVAAAVDAQPGAVSKTIELNQTGSKDTDKNRTAQSFQFENADWTGIYIKPGMKAKFQITLTTDAAKPNVTWAHRQAGRVDANQYALVRADDGGILKAGVNEITYDTTNRKVGQVLLIRNDGGDKASVTITDLNDSLGEYPLYEYDANHPEAFWTYLQELRQYVESGVDAKAGDLLDNPSLHMDMTSLVLGRMVYDMRAAKMVDSVKDLTDEQSAVKWIQNVYKVSNDRLDYFDKVLGFDESDADVKQKPTRMKVVLELTQNLSSPSTMFAWYTMYHLPESVWPGVATSVEGSHGWGNDHEFGHMLDISPLTRTEETNNLISMWGRRLAGLTAMSADKPFTTGTYHGGALNAQKQLDSYVNSSLAGGNPTSPWGDIWYDMLARFNVLHWFDQYDYSTYDYAKYPAYSKDMADQVTKYGGLGAVYRQVRRNAYAYSRSGGVYEAAARAYSDALGFDMSEVMGRFGMPTSDATKEYTSKYPKLESRVEFYSIDADAKEINGATPFATTAKAPSLTVTRADATHLTINASYPDGSAEAKSVSGYALLKDGQLAGWSQSGQFTVETVAAMPKYEVVAYDVRVNPSPAATVVSTATVNVAARIAGTGKADGAIVALKPDDPRLQDITVPVNYGRAELKDAPSGTVTVSLDGYTAYPASAHVDAYTWNGGSLQFTLVKADETVEDHALRPIVTGMDDNGSLAFTIQDPNTGGGDVYYTVDGSEPSVSNGIRWTGGTIKLDSSPVTVKAIVYKAGKLPSPVSEATFTDSRTIGIYNAIYGPSMGVGERVDLSVGDHAGASELGKVFDQLRALRIPDGLKVTVFENEDFTGASRSYTQTVNWVNGYDRIPSKAVRVETVKAPAAGKAGLLSFDSNGVNVLGSMPIIQLFKDTVVTVPDAKYSRSGYTFTGWKDRTGKDWKPGDLLSPSADGSNIMLSAQWAQSPYTVVFDANGGTGEMDGLTVEAGQEATMPESKFTRTGYKFAGWRVAGGDLLQPGDSKVLSDKGGATVVLSAEWTPIQYRVTFDGGDKTVEGTMGEVTATYDADATLPANAFTRTGYKFAGWRTDKGVDYADKATIRNLTSEDNGVVRLTAQWTPITYTVKFDAGAENVTGSMDDLTATYDEQLTLPSMAYTRTGYSFTGWRLPDGTTIKDKSQIMNLTGEDNGTITLTAVWEKDKEPEPTPDPDPSPDPDPDPSPGPDPSPNPEPSPEPDDKPTTPDPDKPDQPENPDNGQDGNPDDDNGGEILPPSDGADSNGNDNQATDAAGGDTGQTEQKTDETGKPADTLAQTGTHMWWMPATIAMLLTAIGVTWLDWRRHRNHE